MINGQAVFRKSAKGISAIATRQAGLPPRLRSALIVVDGKRNAADLAKLVSVLGEPELLLNELQAAGLIELAVDITGQSGASAAVQRSAAAAQVNPARPTPAAAVPTLDGARRFAAKLLMQTLGPSSEGLCLKIEGARNMAEFIASIKRARDTVRDVKGQAVAQTFIEQVESQTPPA